ncbi:MAG TPA: (2Fe-2S)-binding protein [Gemmatimonadaceae bacterium]|nr:(2Fe-2S)-binding protein [Gemmatimonadaceae bacterium]
MQLTINGATHDIELAGHETLLRVLRDRLQLTGTKESCARGECGACTVLVAGDGGPRRAVYSCLTLAAACGDVQITTIEGVAQGSVLHPLQQAFIAHDAMQCGFCTPGQILAALALLERTPMPSESDIRTALSGNLCRCGTYPNILLAVRAAAEQLHHGR